MITVACTGQRHCSCTCGTQAQRHITRIKAPQQLQGTSAHLYIVIVQLSKLKQHQACSSREACCAPVSRLR